MGTWDSSTIRVSQRDRPCNESRMPNPHHIAKGEPYLVYKLGQRNDVAVCVECAITVRTGDGRYLKYDCATVQAEIAVRAASSDDELAEQGSPI